MGRSLPSKRSGRAWYSGPVGQKYSSTWQMALQAPYRGRGMANYPEEKIYRLEGLVLSLSGDSHFWAGLMATKKHFFRFGSFNIKDGSEVRFWEDKWLGSATLRERYPALYNIVHHKN